VNGLLSEAVVAHHLPIFFSLPSHYPLITLSLPTHYPLITLSLPSQVKALLGSVFGSQCPASELQPTTEVGSIPSAPAQAAPARDGGAGAGAGAALASAREGEVAALAEQLAAATETADKLRRAVRSPFCQTMNSHWMSTCDPATLCV